jgi:hypothetical protein
MEPQEYAPQQPKYVVDSNSTAGQLMSLLRSLLLGAAAWAVGRGYIDEATGSSIVGVLLIVAPIVWSQLVTKSKHDQVKEIAAAAPNDIAVVK